MDKHVTIRLKTQEDYESIMQLVGSHNIKIVQACDSDLKVECHIDDFLLTLSQVFLNVEVIHHNAPPDRTSFN